MKLAVKVNADAFTCIRMHKCIHTSKVKKNRLEKKTSQMTALCLSQDIAAKAMILEWEEIWISSSPTTQNMVEYFNEKK